MGDLSLYIIDDEYCLHFVVADNETSAYRKFWDVQDALDEALDEPDDGETFHTTLTKPSGDLMLTLEINGSKERKRAAEWAAECEGPTYLGWKSYPRRLTRVREVERFGLKFIEYTFWNPECWKEYQVVYVTLDEIRQLGMPAADIAEMKKQPWPKPIVWSSPSWTDLLKEPKDD